MFGLGPLYLSRVTMPVASPECPQPQWQPEWGEPRGFPGKGPGPNSEPGLEASRGQGPPGGAPQEGSQADETSDRDRTLPTKHRTAFHRSPLTINLTVVATSSDELESSSLRVSTDSSAIAIPLGCATGSSRRTDVHTPTLTVFAALCALMLGANCTRVTPLAPTASNPLPAD